MEKMEAEVLCLDFYGKYSGNSGVTETFKEKLNELDLEQTVDCIPCAFHEKSELVQKFTINQIPCIVLVPKHDPETPLILNGTPAEN
jgi:hypothetical protein